MKIKIKQTFRSMWAIILAVLMILSTFSAVAVTLNVESTGAITGNIYFDNTKTQYSSVYCFLGHSTYIKSYKMSLDSDNIWKTDTSFNNEWNDATNIYFASADGGVSGGTSSYNMSTSRSTLGLTSYTNKSSTVRAGTSSCYVPDTTDNNSTLSIMTVDEAKASHSGGSVSSDIISVLNGTKIMFYAGVQGSWGSSTIYLRPDTNTSNTTLTLSGINSNSVKINNVDCYYGVACLSSAQYYISNSGSWGGVRMSENAVAGKYYILNNNSTLSGSSSNNVYANASSGSATTTISSSNVVSTSFTAGQSGKGTAYELVYYIKDSSDTYSKVGTSASEVNDYISGLEEGTYTLYTCSTDKTITVLRDTDTFTVAGSYNVSTGVKVSTDGSSFTVDSTKTAPTGGGEITGSTTLTASEISGYTFVGWDVTAGATISGTNMSVSYTPTADTTVYAKYSKNYTVSIGTHTNGTITVDGAETDKTVAAGTSVTIVASPSSGYAFSAWTGDLSGEASATVTKTVTSDITANATFAKEVNYYYLIGRLTIKDKNGNSVSTGSTSVDYSETSTNIPFELVDEDAQLYRVVTKSTVAELTGSNWYFRIRKGTATAANGVQYNPSSSNFDLKSSATSTTLSEGSSYNLRFQDSSNTSGPVILWFNASTLKFYYTIATNSISYVSDANGDFTDKVTEASPGTVVEVKPNPNTGYVLDTLKYNDGSDHTITETDGKYTFTMPDCDVTVTATFTENSTPDVANGVTLKASSAEVIQNNPVTLKATLDTPNESAENVIYTFTQTSGSTVSLSPNETTDATTTFTPTEAGTYKFTVTASCAGFNSKTSSVVEVTVITATDAKKNAFTSGIWVDAQPSSSNKDALIKAYTGKSGYVKFYLPNCVTLSDLHIYHKYGYLEIAGTQIESGSTVNASSWTNGNVNIKYGDSSSSNTSATIQVFKSTAKTLFTSTSADMPTTTNSSVSDAKTAAAYKSQCSFSGTYRAIDAEGNAIANNSIKLKGRGNSSWEMSSRIFGKYAYNITLGGAVDLVSVTDKSTASKKWSMLANNVDEAMMRNMLVYNLSDAIGLPDSPMSDVYNVYNNGTYLGSYQMSEKVEVGTDVLVPGTNVDKLNESKNKTSGAYNTDTQTSENGSVDNNSTKGFFKYCTLGDGFIEPSAEEYKAGNYLLEFELNERFPDEVSGFISNYGQQVVLKSPEFASRNEVLYAMDRFNFAEALIYYLASKDTSTSVSLPAGTLTINGDSYSYKGTASGNTYTASSLDELIDVENFAKAYLIQEFTENLDGVATSFYVDITGENDALVSKPVWDFDWTMGQYGNGKDIGSATLNPDNPEQWFIKNKYIYKNSSTKNIIATLCSIESFWDTVKTVWNGFGTSTLATGSAQLFPVSALMGKKASLNPVGAGTTGVYDAITDLYGDGGLITGDYKTALESSVTMNEDRYSFISDSSYSQWGSKDTGSSWSAAVEYLDNWTEQRATWMNARLNDVPEEKNYLYFKDEGNYNTDSSTIYAHIYNNSTGSSYASWPGTKMELIDSENKIYRVEYVDNNFTNVIFSKSGNSQIGTGNDTITQFGTNNMLVYRSSSDYTWTTYQEAGTYSVNKATTSNGSFTVSPSTAKENATITITATPSDGYAVDTVTVTGSSGTVDVTGSGNTYTFTMPAEDVTVTVTFKEQAVGDYVVYLDNEASWSNPYAYAWNSDTDKNDAWPGVAMTHVSGNIYKLTFTKAFANIIFSNNSANKTEDLTLENGKIYNNSTNTWSVYDPDKGITVSAGTCTGGSVKINGATSVSDLKLGDQITLTAVADSKYAFTGWNEVSGLTISDTTSAQTSASITSVDADIEVKANFSSSQSGYYIKGTFNSWDTSKPLYTTSGTVSTTTITLDAGTYTFKVWKESGNVWYGNSGTIEDTTTTTSIDGWTMSSSAGNCTLVATGGTYTFTFDSSTNKLIITQGAAGKTVNVISQDPDGVTLSSDSLAYISSYTKVGEDTPSANTTASVKDIKEGTSVIFTAPENQYYTFSHWLVNGVVTDPTESDGVSLKIDDVTYDFDVYAVYNYITSDVSIATGIEHGTVETDKTTGVKAGESVTITLTPDSGYSTNTVKVTDADDSNIPVNKLSANKYTFVMPNKNVTVSATFVEVDSYTVTFASIDTSMGTVSSDNCVSGKKYAQGTELTVKATPTSGYMFDGWYSDAQLSTQVSETEEYTFTVSGDTTLYAKFVIAKGDKDDTLHAIFKSGNNNPSEWSSSDNYDVYKVVSGSTYADAGYSHMFDIDIADIEANKEFYFALSSSTSYSNMYWSDNTDGTAKVGKDDPNSFLDTCEIQHYGYNGKNYYFPKIKVSSQNLLSLTGVTVYVKTTGTAAGQYLVVPKGKTKPDNTVTIYAKNGTLKTTYAYGTTTVTGISEDCEDFTSLGTPYSTYYALKDDRIVAHTEVNATQAGYGWYVYAYVINGVEYRATKVDGTTSTYQMDTPYIVQEGQDVEITPIYLNTNIEKEDGYVTLYVDAVELGDHWGNTISVYSYYYENGSVDGSTKQMNSSYPGEPMMLESTGLYKAFVPKNAWGVVNDEFVQLDGYSVSGLTLNNYMEGETVHQKFLSADQKKNYQTYDYDDFKIIAEAGYDTVKFDIKYRTNTTNQSSLLDNANDHPVKTGSIDPSTYSYTITDEEGKEVTVSEWEDLKDIDGRLASIVGFTSDSVPSGEPFDDSEENKLYIVSTGNQNTSMGEWSTVWYVYDHNGDYITQGLPSDFIPRYTKDAEGNLVVDSSNLTDAYNVIVEKGYQYTSAYIAYESEQNATTSSNSGNSGIRLDGRWYYARSTAELTVKTHVLYADKEDATSWTEDTYNADYTGVTTGALATVDDVRTTKVTRNTSVTISASPSALGSSDTTYKFIGWATDVVEDAEGKFNPTKSTTLVDSTSTFSVASDTDAYALYVPVGEGDLVITHSAYSKVNANANGGTGRYFVQAVVTHSDYTTDTYYAQNGVTVPITSEDKTVDVTLYTVSTNGCTYVGTYVYNGTITEGSKYQDITGEDNAYVGKVNPASAPATVTHSIPVNQIFGGSLKLTSTLDYYSDLKTNTITVKLNYYDRKVAGGT
ncbi:MAG: starch-binding protein, partial [Ruminococcus sp.]